MIKITIITTFILLSLVLALLIKKFHRKDLFLYLEIPLIFFAIGFLMRINQNLKIIDLGFFFTDISYLYLNILFVLALLLGQIKYWKK